MAVAAALGQAEEEELYLLYEKYQPISQFVCKDRRDSLLAIFVKIRVVALPPLSHREDQGACFAMRLGRNRRSLGIMKSRLVDKEEEEDEVWDCAPEKAASPTRPTTSLEICIVGSLATNYGFVKRTRSQCPSHDRFLEQEQWLMQRKRESHRPRDLKDAEGKPGKKWERIERGGGGPLDRPSESRPSIRPHEADDL